MLRTIAVTKEPTGAGRLIRVVIVGFGPIGRAAAERILDRGRSGSLGGRWQLSGVIDPASKYAGQPLDRLGVPAPELIVQPSLDAWSGPADVAIVTTTSRLSEVAPTLEACLARRLAVVSSCEELFYPELFDRPLARHLDDRARRAGVGLVGVGINPGFLMDLLPRLLALATGPVHRVRCRRVVDVTHRRLPLRHKVGVGISPEEFHARAEQGRIGHVGLVQSVAYLAAELGLAIDTIRESLEPVLAVGGGEYPEGSVLGIDHQAWGMRGAEVNVHLHLQMFAGGPDPHDRIVLDADPPIDCRITPCVAGDAATAAILINWADQVLAAAPGLHLAHEMSLRPANLPGRVTGGR